MFLPKFLSKRNFQPPSTHTIFGKKTFADNISSDIEPSITTLLSSRRNVPFDSEGVSQDQFSKPSSKTLGHFSCASTNPSDRTSVPETSFCSRLMSEHSSIFEEFNKRKKFKSKFK